MSDLLRILYAPTPVRGSVPAPPRTPSPSTPTDEMTLAERTWLELEMWPHGKRAAFTSEYDALKY